MTNQTKIFLQRLELYIERTRDALEQNDYASALAHMAEACEIARRCWLHLEAIAKAHPP